MRSVDVEVNGRSGGHAPMIQRGGPAEVQRPRTKLELAYLRLSARGSPINTGRGMDVCPFACDAEKVDYTISEPLVSLREQSIMQDQQFMTRFVV